MNMQTIDTKLVRPNPWQPRTAIDPDAVAELANSILTQGLLQPPVARSINGHYELAFGHRRFLAWQSARPGEPMPLLVETLSDRQMAEHAAVENAARRDLNPIERAHAIKRLMAEFAMTQVEAGALFGLASQGAVSNALRLLALPEPVLDHVAAGDLPERLARQLVPLVKHLAKATIAVADKIAKSAEKERDFDGEMREVLNKHARSFGYGRNIEAVQKVIVVTPTHTKWAAKVGRADKVQACAGCEFFLKRGRNWETCLFPGCFDLKESLVREAEVAAVAKARGLVMADAGEHYECVFNGCERDLAWAKVLIKSKHASLRVKPMDGDWLSDWQTEPRNRMAVLGHKFAELGTTLTEAELKRAVPAPAAKKVSGGQPAKRSSGANSYAATEARRKAVERLIAEAAPAFCNLLPKDKLSLAFIVGAMDNMIDPDKSKDLRLDISREAVRNLTSDRANYFHNCDLAVAAQALLDLAGELKVKLPPSIAAAAKPPAPPATTKKGK